MKLIVFCIFLIGFVRSQNELYDNDTDPYAEDMARRQEMALECIKKVGIDIEVVQKAITTEVLPKTSKYKDFLACSYKKQGYLSQDGKMIQKGLVDFLSRFYDPEDLKALKKCTEPVQSTDGETAYTALECILPLLRQMKEKRSKV